MFTKSLILVLLGSTLILGNPLPDEPEATKEVSKTLADRVWSWLKDTAKDLKDIWSSGVEVTKSVLKEIKERGKYAGELGKDAYDYLFEKGVAIAKNSADAIAAEKAAWDKKISELKNSGRETAQTLAYKLKQLKKQASEGLAQTIQEAKDTWSRWKQECKESYERENENKQ